VREARVGLGRDWLGLAATGVLVTIILVAIFGPLIEPYPPNEQNLTDRLAPPAWDAGGSSAHLLGTDELGRDMLSRIIAGARIDLTIGFAGAAIEAIVGVTVGLVAGYFGGRTEKVLMWWTDIQMGFPVALLIIFILLLFGGGLWMLILALGLNAWMIFARLTRNEVRRLKETPFVQAALVTGASSFTILRRHILPHIRGAVTAVYLLEVPRVILAGTALSFVGLGIQPPQISWGMMISGSRDLLSVAYWIGVFPGIAIFVTVASLSLFASWIEPRIDPLRRRAMEARSRA
jgi:peptide/nickel transport system permease protein